MFCFLWTVAKKLFIIACISNPIVQKKKKSDNSVSVAVYSVIFSLLKLGWENKALTLTHMGCSPWSQPVSSQAQGSRWRHRGEWSSRRWKPKGHQRVGAIFGPRVLIFPAVSITKAVFNYRKQTWHYLEEGSGNLDTNFGFSPVAQGGWLGWPGKWTPLAFVFSLYQWSDISFLGKRNWDNG